MTNGQLGLSTAPDAAIDVGSSSQKADPNWLRLHRQTRTPEWNRIDLRSEGPQMDQDRPSESRRETLRSRERSSVKSFASTHKSPLSIRTPVSDRHPTRAKHSSIQDRYDHGCDCARHKMTAHTSASPS